jgi:predicted ATPase
VLDNFEQLLRGAGLLTDILTGARAVTILVTSRERLNLKEEWVLSVEGLRFPDGRHAPAPIDQYPAVELFVQRARQVHASFALSENVQPVLDICRRVEGMPLALELAATWLRVMPCEQIALHIERSLDFLSTPLRNVPEGHRSLRAVFDRSWSLLTDLERAVLSQLSVFRGGFDMDAAEHVAGASLSLLADLIDKSLVRPMRASRYDMHELVRQYLTEKLADSGDTCAAAGRHFGFYSRLAAVAEAQLYGPDQELWFDRLEVEHDNFAAALSWSLSEGHAEDGLRLATTLAFFWELKDHFHEAYGWFRTLLDNDVRAPASVRTKALSSAGLFASYVGRAEEAMALSEEAVARARDLGDQLNIAWSLSNLMLIRLVRRTYDLGQAVAWLEEALRLFRAAGDGWGTNHALRRLGWALTDAGEYERAAPFLEEALTLARSAQNKGATGWSLVLLGKVTWLLTRDVERTRALHEEALSLARQTRNAHLLQQALSVLGYLAYVQKNYIAAESHYTELIAMLQERRGADYPGWFLSPVVVGFAQLAVARGQPEQAARLFGAVHGILAGSHHLFADRSELDHDISSAREQLGEARFAVAYTEGQKLSIAQATTYALQSSHHSAGGDG